LPATMLTIAAGAAPDAMACSNTSGDHCYAVAIANDVAANHGMFGYVYATCLYMPDNGDFVNNEMWNVSSGSSYWEEVGLKSGTAYSGIYYPDKTWFWADSRPGGGYHEHEPDIGVAGTNTSYAAESIYLGDNEWGIYGGNSFTEIGVSTSQSASLVDGEAGTEYTAGSSSGIRNIGNVAYLERESTGNDWYYWGAATQSGKGPGGYISGSYAQSNEQESWSGPC
jgi:hypothetical protein